MILNETPNCESEIQHRFSSHTPGSYSKSDCNSSFFLRKFTRKFVYQVDRPEPTSYSHLFHRSVVRGVTAKLQHLCSVTDRSADDARAADRCLVALLQPTPKPLPSLSWAFLSQLNSSGDNVTRLAAKQSQISPSGRKITESCIAASGDNVSTLFKGYHMQIHLFSISFEHFVFQKHFFVKGLYRYDFFRLLSG